MYYFDGTHEYNEDDPDDRGNFAIIMAHGVDGNVADVYGETVEDAERTARQIISVMNFLRDDDLLRKFAQEIGGAREVHRAWRDTRLVQGRYVEEKRLEWGKLDELDRQLAATIAFDLLRDFAVWARSHDAEGNHI